MIQYGHHVHHIAGRRLGRGRCTIALLFTSEKTGCDPKYELPLGRWKVGDPEPCPFTILSVSINVTGENRFGRVNGDVFILSNWSIEITIDELGHQPEYLIAVGDGPKGYKLHPKLRYTLDGIVWLRYRPIHSSED